MTDERKTCANIQDLIAGMVSADVSVPELAAARAHLESCADCRDYRDALQADGEWLAAYADAHAGRIATLRNRAVAALPDARPVRVAGWRRFARSGALRTALAASLAGVVFLAVFFGGEGESVVWAEVYETVARITSGRFRLTDRTGSDVNSEQIFSERGLSHRTYEDGRVVESLHLDYEDRVVTYLAYSLELAVQLEIDDSMIDAYEDRSPDKLFAFLTENEHEDLGRRRIDGRRLQGVRVVDAAFMAERLDHAELELWVDPEDRLPVRLEVKGEVAGGQRRRHVRFHDFRWNIDIPEAEFHPEIPDGYSVSRGPRLVLDEDGCLEGLRLFADITGGRYPSTLAYESVRVELWRDLEPDRSEIGGLIADMFRIRVACQFYGRLVEREAGPVYFGHAVRDDDPDRVLLRWQLEDDRYRVIYGDLRAGTVSGEELLRLEG